MKPSEAKPTNVVDSKSATANMYGCEPCPNCKKKYRYPVDRADLHIQCDDCGHRERAVLAEED